MRTSFCSALGYSFPPETDSVWDRKQQVQSAVFHLTVSQVQLCVAAAVSQDGGDGPAVSSGQTQRLSLIVLW